MRGKESPLLGILFSLPRKAAIETPFPKPRSQGASGWRQVSTLVQVKVTPVPAPAWGEGDTFCLFSCIALISPVRDRTCTLGSESTES